MKRGSPICKIPQHDAKIDGSTENTDAKTTNTSRSSFGKIGWSNNGRLTDSKAHDESARKYLTIVSGGGDVNDNTDDPNNAQLTSSPNTS